jgi:signal transduction histidine kinase
MPASPTAPVNILLVDDQPAKLLSYEVILGELGENLVTASSAREALTALLKIDVAVVLIDVQMPELDGFELAALIREHPRFQQTALIFVSAIHLSDLDRIKGYEAGAVDYVPVPVIPEVLRAKVRVFAELHRKTRELERLNAELERRVAERTSALEKLNEELEVRIEQRTREREQALAQLFEAQKVDTIGQLTGGVAHDFNNLLMATLGSLEILRKRLGDDATAKRLLDNAVKGAERGAALTQRLLAFARRQDLKPRTVVVGDLVHGMKDLLDRSLGPKIRVEQHLPRDLPNVLIDPNQLELALLNLAVNARDAMVDGGTVLLEACEAHPHEDAAPETLSADRYVRLSVIDDGAGMDDDVLSRATEPFFTTKGVGKGTGLGLSMVQGLVAQSGGALSISSRRGMGSRVDLWLPVADAVVGSPQPLDQSSPDIATIGRVITVLVVDDDVLVCAGTTAMLEDLGHTVVQASSALEGLAIIDQGDEIDLVITDHAMPGMTGMELARYLADVRPNLPVVVASGYADLPQLTAPVLEVSRLSKPFSQRDLARAIADKFGDRPQTERNVSERSSGRSPASA